MTHKTCLVIAGPTAVGKTALAIAVAQALGTEILSADSRQCYQGMAIGTAQPTPEERAFVPHHFVDCFSVTEGLNAGFYEGYGLRILDEIFRKKDVAVVCGGTGLYIKALLEGLDEMPPVIPEIAGAVEAGYKENGPDWLRERLLEEDPKTFAVIDNRNPARLLRALSFHRSTGKSLVDFRKNTPVERPFRVVKIALDLPRPVLYDRIHQRVDAMMGNGLLEEVKAMLPYRDLRPLQTVGYSELFRHLDGKWTLEEAVDKIKQHTRNYAKRQLTWFRNAGGYEWISAERPDAVAKILAAV